VVALDLDAPEAEAVFRTHYAVLVRHLAYLLGERGAAEDVAQEAFLRYFARPPREPGDPAPWLRVVATRLALNYLRGERRRRSREAGLHGDPALGPAAAAPPATEGLSAALERLQPRDRLALLLRAAGQSYGDIAPAIGVRPGSVGTILARATRRLKAEYRSDDPQDRPTVPSPAQRRPASP